ncbi:CobW family GTP-binding protein [Anaerotalea alkaliphila]|uniref:GTP-binding protein n=1 Tax=Anaerotalea alkaliphila TaxID=2662126 RepID=A0A7X5KPM0_9FIRM|nr:CobW family GTP-binding protein [Anaerotalea alkaliphila]NDL68342.1 GTP-binding protein [Anaerotalea alkaliphila]
MIPIDIITGFLGAGKTTFLKNILLKGVFAEEKVVLIENEYGQVNMDARFLEGVGIPIYEITKGCLCCSLKTDFITTLKEILESVKPDRILVEPSGIFVTESFKEMLQDSSLREDYRINSITSVLDVTLFDGRFLPYEGFLSNGVRHAGQILLSKCDLADDGMLQNARAFINRHNSHAAVYDSAAVLAEEGQCRALFARGGKADPNTCACGCSGGHGHSHDHSSHDPFVTVSLDLDGSLGEKEFETWMEGVASGAFGDIIRMKGYIRIQGKTHEIQYQHNRYTCVPKQDAVERHQVVAIGKHIRREWLAGIDG